MELNESEKSFCDRERNVMCLWREAGLPEYFLGNDGTNQKLVAFTEAVADDMVRAEREQCAVLAESGITETFGSGVRRCTVIHSYPHVADAIRARSQKTEAQA